MAKQVRKEPEWAQLKLRVPYALRKRLEREAVAHHHSLNAEVMHRIELSFKIISQESIEARVKRLEGTVTSYMGVISTEQEPDDK